MLGDGQQEEVPHFEGDSTNSLAKRLEEAREK